MDPYKCHISTFTIIMFMIIITINPNIISYLTQEYNQYTVFTECLDARLDGIEYYIHTLCIIPIYIITSCITVHKMFQYSIFNHNIN